MRAVTGDPDLGEAVSTQGGQRRGEGAGPDDLPDLRDKRSLLDAVARYGFETT
jgi:hypothetical protein